MRSARRSAARSAAAPGYENIVRAIRWAASTRRKPEQECRHDGHRCTNECGREPDRLRADAAQGRRRFIRGQGKYVDDIEMPGMLYGAILRSPVAHTLIKSIDTSAAEAHPKVKAVITGAVLETLGLAWVPTLSYDTAGGARHRQGALPGPRGRVRDRRGQVLRPRRVGVDRRRLRDPASGDRCQEGARTRRAGDPYRQGRQDRQPHLRLGSRRRGQVRRRVRQGRRDRQAGHAVSADASLADGDVRVGGLDGQGHRAVDDLVHITGTTCPPHGVCPRGGPSRTQDQGDLARHRRWLRQQGRHLQRLRAGNRRFDRHRASR